MNEWQSPLLAQEYAGKAFSRDASWYEHQVNFPDLVRLIPDGTKSVVDFGCGSGEFTALLAERYPRVIGLDMAAMLSVAKKNQPELTLVEWDGFSDIPTGLDEIDVIFSKLVIQFIENLDELLANLKQILKSGGHVIISVPNPQRIAEKFCLNPEIVSKYEDEIGETGIKINPIYRPEVEYQTIFSRNGFMLSETSIPKIADTIVVERNLSLNQAADTKRLNMSFKLVT